MKRFPPPSHRVIPTRSKKQKREPSGASKRSRAAEKERARDKERREREWDVQAKKQKLVRINRERLVSFGVGTPTLGGKYYLDWPFTCTGCRSAQVWTGRQQKWWYEEMRGDREQIAVRCRDCRVKERARREQARKVHLEGLEQKARRTLAGNLLGKKRKRPGTW